MVVMMQTYEYLVVTVEKGVGVRLKISFSLLFCKLSHFCVESERGQLLHYIRALGT